MKFETYVYKIVLDPQPNFHKEPCKNAHARGVNTRTRDEMRVHVCTDLNGQLLSYEHKFQIS